MARHSQFNNIKHRKEAMDRVRGKVFTVHARLIAVAARAGGDPKMNTALAAAIERAREANVPNSNIERAIKKGTGEDKEGTVFEEATYEAFGPGGTGLMIDVITDNKNRAVTNVRTLLMKNGGNMGSSGAVAWKFDKKACFLVLTNGIAADEAELKLIDAGAEDLFLNDDDGSYEVYSAPDQLGAVRTALQAAGFKVQKDELVWKPKDETLIEDLELARALIKLTDLIDENEDVVRVTHNANFSPAVLTALEAE